MYLVLASQSPRRREILMNAGYHIRISPSNVDEMVYEIYPEDRVVAIARKKGLDIYNKFKDDDQAIILSADTIVVIDDEILGKPKDKDDARNMIQKLQGRTHNVYTAVFIKSKEYEDSFLEKTEVSVVQMSAEEIETYISSSEPYDKAGGYAIQGNFSQYITKINGDYYNVMGLPISKVKQILNKYDLTETLKCPKCQQKVDEKDAFCMHCGTKLNIVNKRKVCPICHRESRGTNKFCEFCGNDLRQAVSYVYDDNECPICHHVSTPGVEYCESCGTMLKLNEKAKQEVALQQFNLLKKDYSEKAFIFSLIGIFTATSCCVLISLVFGILACVFGGISLSRGYRGKALAATIIGAITIVLTILSFVLIVLMIMASESVYN